MRDVIDNFNSSDIQSVINYPDLFAKMIQFDSDDKNQKRLKFAYHIRTVLNNLQSTFTASLLSQGQTGLKDLFKKTLK